MQNTHQRELYIGLMSGTSTDGIDAALFNFQADKVLMLASHQHIFDKTIKQEIIELTQPSFNEIDKLGALDVSLGRYFSAAVQNLLSSAQIVSKDVVAIGSHGQTIRHRPYQESPFSMQIGDPNTIAQTTKITTVADFRRRDMAAGGQGAPLAPAFHRTFFYSAQESRCIVNIGGISNISVLASDVNKTLGYDTGPGNVLLDAWINKNEGQSYDDNGQWASTGKINPTLLSSLLSHDYFQKPYPKSTGREDFHLDALLTQLETTKINADKDVRAEDVQATLCEFTAQSIANDVSTHNPQALYICGGGAQNSYLMERLKANLKNCKVATTEALGVHPDWVEAGLLAWLARQTLKSQQGNLPSVTGASSGVVLGGIYPA